MPYPPDFWGNKTDSQEMAWSQGSFCKRDQDQVEPPKNQLKFGMHSCKL